MPTFAQIQEEIASMLSIPDDELSSEQREAMHTYLDELASMETSKIDGFGQFLKIQSSLADACKEEAKRLAGKAKAAEEKLSYLKESYLMAMRQQNLKKISGNAYTISVRESEVVAITSLVESLPELYRREKISLEPEKVLIKEALKGGVIIPGCTLIKSYSLQVS